MTATATRTFTLRNDFHNSSQVRRVRSKLCGISGCTCGGVLSERGEQECEIDVRGNMADVVVLTSL